MGQIMRDEFYNIVRSRKSIRQFKKQEVPHDVLERLLEAASHAPSGKNNQNWRFFVVQGKKRDEYLKYSQKSWLGIKDVLQKKLKPSLYEFTERFFFTMGDAPVIIFAYSWNSPEEKHYTSIGSVYMAVQNINLACTVEELGCCTMGAPLEIQNEVDQFLGVDQLEEYKKGELELLCAVAIGYPDHNPPKAPRQTDNRVTWLK
ncbi:MAG: nitroreductase family protein [Pseudobdellovibrio sp.]